MASYQLNHHGGSATYVVTPPEPSYPASKTQPHVRTSSLNEPSSSRLSYTNSIQLGSLSTPNNGTLTPGIETDTLPPPNAVDDEQHLDRWNYPRANLFRTLASFWSLFLTGVNDGTYGAMIPYLETYYSLSYLSVSLIFLSPAVGYIVSAALNGSIHLRFGQRGIALVAPLCHVISYIIIAQHPPFPVLVIVYLLVGIGNGLSDAAWNAWIGAMHNPNQVLGFLHAAYGAGATVAPLAATAVIVKLHRPWYIWYYVLLAGSVLESSSCSFAFWRFDGAAYRASHGPATTQSKSPLLHALSHRPTARVLWLASLFLLGYVGVEVTLGGWIVSFMRRERHGQALASSVAATGFWLGITIGRIVLGFVTPRLGEKLSITIYLPLAAGLQLLFWLVPSFTVSAIAVAFQGFFLGPMFPAAVVACTKLLPKRLHVSGIGFAAAFGGSGGAVLPFATGALAQAKGVGVLQPIVLALLCVTWGLWVGLPRIERKRE